MADAHTTARGQQPYGGAALRARGPGAAAGNAGNAGIATTVAQGANGSPSRGGSGGNSPNNGPVNLPYQQQQYRHNQSRVTSDSYEPQWVDEELGSKSRLRMRRASTDPSIHRQLSDWPIMLFLLVAAFGVRFYKIWHPDQVVFDEVHFGKFAAYYLRRQYFFDVHPPLAKLINAAAGYLAGFDGSFEFDAIGDKYAEHNVPYVRMRCAPALMGSLQVPLAYAIMRETGHAPSIAVLSAAMILFDNAHITQDRLILLDAALVLFMMCSIYSYIRFYKQRYNEFTAKWWAWMLVTGASLSLTMSCKMVGLFTFVSIGVPVAIDLWNILDIRRGHTMRHVAKHVGARVMGLIVWPALFYMFWFWVHFAILVESGTGDTFMSSEFQQTLRGNPMLESARDIHYYDRVTMKHKATGAYLHSHPDRYPLKYDDGRISSQGQQVTGYPHNDTNNIWQILPTKEVPAEGGEEAAVKNGDIVRLLHLNTASTLLAHDVASPLMATHEEFTTFPFNDTSRYNDTLFEFLIDGQDTTNNKVTWKSKSSWFRLVHVNTRVAMWTHTTPLPAWGFQQQEINGNKNIMEKTALWFVDDLHPNPAAPDYETRIQPPPQRNVTHMNFFRKFVELQLSMLHHNNLLTSSHPYASSPIHWPFLLSGISFWTDMPKNEQIYMIGNILSWWAGVLSISVYCGIMLADALARRRGVYPIPSAVRNRLISSTGFFVLAWAFHYLPFFSMNRQLFLHHYLPAHVLSCLVTGAVFNFVATETMDYPLSKPGPGLPPEAWRSMTRNTLSRPTRAICGAFVGALIVVFWFFAPLTYGSPALTQEQVGLRKLFNTWTLHFAKV